MKGTKILFLLCFFLFFSLWSCQKEQETVDQIFHNAHFYTVDDSNPTATALAVKDGRIIAIGAEEEILSLKGEETTMHNLDGAFAMPGFIEGHGHFSSLGIGLMNLNFILSKNWEEIIEMVREKSVDTSEGAWISGSGWHQEKWDTSPTLSIDNYPTHHQLSALTQNHPVVLGHASGHSLFANAKAMEIAGVSSETPDPRGGRIVRDAQGEAIGVFEEEAMFLIWDAYNVYRKTLGKDALSTEWHKGIQLAVDECLAKGITSFQDAGADFQEIKDYQNLAENNKLGLRLWTMARVSYTELTEGLDQHFPIINAADHFFSCRAIKTEIDGALGSFGAWLLAPYEDKPDFVGQNTTLLETIDSIAGVAIDKNMQLCVHAIGDKANREVLNLFEKHFKNNTEKDLRWRMEHSQHVDPEDIPRFAQLGVIASMQAIHCTSDAPFVEKRLGEDRARNGSYSWRSLLDAGAVVTNGTDAPVEDVDPIPSFYASVTRKRIDNGLEFYPEQVMTRKEAIYAYTMANAYAAFEENDKGSLSVGKLADIVVLSEDLFNCSETDILNSKVLMTVVGGEVKYELE